MINYKEVPEKYLDSVFVGAVKAILRAKKMTAEQAIQAISRELEALEKAQEELVNHVNLGK